MISFLIYWLLAERFSSGKRFRQDFYPHSAFSSFSCFKNTFLGTFSSGQIGTSLLPGRMVYILELLFSLGEWFTFWNFFLPWENGLHFGTSLLPGKMVLGTSLLPGKMVQFRTSLLPERMVYILELLFSLGEWFTFWNFSSPWENGSVFQLASIFLPKSVGFLSKSTYGDT